ncbi:MAG: class 1 fructose-bisphosphatase [Myxococcales bacterium]|nr:class 1 fructose-bisphosphatase [Myxococcales bacterium]
MTATPPVRENLVTLESRLTAGKHGCAELAGVIGAIALASKAIAHKIRRARIEDVIGDAGAENLHGERQQKLDLLADALILECVRTRPEVAVYASEEQGEPLVLRPRSDGGRYCVLTDPLDGSSNVDVAVSVGTIFSILPNDQDDANTERAVLQPGSRQLAAGYVLYGSSVLLVLSTGNGVDIFVLDPEIGEYVLVIEDLKMPEKKLYSINEAYWNDFDPGVRAYLGWAHENGYGARYVGSMVADVHRTLLKGGVFLYPSSSKAPEGKLRLLYEGCPMAMLVEQAGGAASGGDGRILDIQPHKLHQRTSVLLGSPGEMEHVSRYIGS